jgi:sensor domain CHASE-containing protein
MVTKGILIVIILLLVSVTIFVFAEQQKTKLTMTDKLNNINQEIKEQTLGVATRIGCLRTSYTDQELINNKIFTEEVIGVRTADLCYING